MAEASSRAPPRKVRVGAFSWNVGTYTLRSDDNVGDWLKAGAATDIFAVGFQEADVTFASMVLNTTAQKKAWMDAVRSAVSSWGSHTEIASESITGIAILVFARSNIVDQISLVDTTIVGCGTANRLGNKGAAVVRFTLGAGTHVCIVNSHLAPHKPRKQVLRRNRDYATINDRVSFATPSMPKGKGEYRVPKVPATILAHDVVVWFGDLNYRVEIDDDETRAIAADPKRWKGAIEEHDQLKQEMRARRVFADYSEGEISFAPTYKFDVGTNTYDTSTKKRRAPAWTDRVLYVGSGVSVVDYGSSPQLISSDHKPIRGVLEFEYRSLGVSAVADMRAVLGPSHFRAARRVGILSPFGRQLVVAIVLFALALRFLLG